MEALLDILLFHSLQCLVQQRYQLAWILPHYLIHGFFGCFGLCFLRFTPNSIMNTLRRFGAAVRSTFPLRAATLAGRFRLDAFTSNLCKSQRTTRNQSTANQNGRQDESRAWRSCGKSSLQSEYLWRYANRNTPRGYFHRITLSA